MCLGFTSQNYQRSAYTDNKNCSFLGLFCAMPLFLQFRIADTGMVHSFQLFFKDTFYCSNIFKCYRTFLEVSFLYLAVYDLVDKSGNTSSVYSFKLLEAASTESAIIRIACSLVNGLGPGYWNASLSLLHRDAHSDRIYRNTL